jgi:hypothetical protein
MREFENEALSGIIGPKRGETAEVGSFIIELFTT